MPSPATHDTSSVSYVAREVQPSLSVRVPVSGWEDAGAFTAYNPASDASPSREAPMPAAERKGSR